MEVITEPRICSVCQKSVDACVFFLKAFVCTRIEGNHCYLPTYVCKDCLYEMKLALNQALSQEGLDLRTSAERNIEYKQETPSQKS